MISSPTIKATLIGFIAPLLWSIYPVLSVAIGQVPPLEIVSIAFFTSFCCSLVILFIRKSSLKNTFYQPFKYWLIGVGGICGFNVLYIFALQSGPPAEIFLMVVSWPIFAIIFSSLILKEILRPWHIAGCALGFSGIIFIAWQQGFSGFEFAHLKGYIAALAAAIIWALYSVLSRKYKNIPIDMVTAFCGATTVIAVILHFNLETTVSLSFYQLLLIFIIGMGPSCLAYYVWNHGVKNGDIRVLSSISFIGHFIALSLLVLAGYSEFKWQTAIACALIVGGAITGSLGMFMKGR